MQLEMPDLLSDRHGLSWCCGSMRSSREYSDLGVAMLVDVFGRSADRTSPAAAVSGCQS